MLDLIVRWEDLLLDARQLDQGGVDGVSVPDKERERERDRESAHHQMNKSNGIKWVRPKIWEPPQDDKQYCGISLAEAGGQRSVLFMLGVKGPIEALVLLSYF